MSSMELATRTPESELVNQWKMALELEQAAGEISSSSRITYQAGLALFLAWLHRRGVDHVDRETIISWKADLVLAGRKPTTVNTYLEGVRRFFRWAHGSGLILSDPIVGIKGAKRKGSGRVHLREALTDREVLRVLASPDRSARGVRDKAILSLMCFCGLRGIEIVRADLIDLTMPVLHVQGKGAREKDDLVVIANRGAQDALYDWLGVRGANDGPLFTSLSNRSKNGRLSSRTVRGLVVYLRKAGVIDKRKTLHSLRHSAISKVARVDVLKARQVARHSSIETTMIYIHEEDRIINPGEALIEYAS